MENGHAEYENVEIQIVSLSRAPVPTLMNAVLQHFLVS